jgi:hypothetical protein
VPSFLTNLAGGKSIADLKAPRSRRGNTNQVVDYWFGGLVAGGDFESIATTTVGSGGQATITFSDIPATYKHLQIRAISRLTNAIGATDVFLRFNSDSAANYSYHSLYGNGASALSVGGGGEANMYPFSTVGTTAGAGTFAVGVADILDYADTNKFKTLRALTGVDYNGAGQLILASGNWRSSSAITTITLTSSTNTFAQYSQFALYGVKG